MSAFLDAFTRTLQHEGGYVHDPDDPGGETKYGISKRSYPLVNIAALTVEQAREIYRRDFWEKPGVDQILDPRLAAKLFDLGANMGPPQAIKLLQRATNLLGANLLDDGVLGPVTSAAVNGYRHPGAILAALKYFAADFYINLGRPKYLAGWLKRLEG